MTTPIPEKLVTIDIEVAVANHFGYRSHLIVPNVFWGLGFKHELDLLVMTEAGYVTEVEIKTSKQDLKRDLMKIHGHRSNRIRRHFLAVPKHLAQCGLDTFPQHWGVLSVSRGYVEILRYAEINKAARPLSQDEIEHLYKLAAMRTWSLKEALQYRIRRDRISGEKEPRP